MVDKNVSDCEALNTFSERLIYEIETIKSKMKVVGDYGVITKSCLETFCTDLENLTRGIQYEIGELKNKLVESNICLAMNYSCEEGRLREELLKTQAVLRLQNLTTSIAEKIEKRLN